MGLKPWGATASDTNRAYLLAGVADASGQTWYEVPGYGFVTWSNEQITVQARYLLGWHRPNRAALRVRIAWSVVPLVWRGRRCKVCQTTWPCQTGAWVRDWLGAVAVAERTMAVAEP
jgi:hypothetical protein